MEQLTDIGMIGLAVMGKSLALNMERNGFKVSLYNRETSVMQEMVKEFPDKNFVGCPDYESFVSSIARPRKIMMMIKAGKPVDEMIKQLLPLLEPDDILIDGGNSNYHDTERRVEELQSKGIHFVGCGVSGGEEGALYGPSLMPGGAVAAKDEVMPILTKIAAKAPDGSPCCAWMGKGGAGHFVKMVHNGIEYGDMQLIAEAYASMGTLLGMDNVQMAEVFHKWNEGKLDSYLIEITAAILRHKDEGTGEFLVDKILDAAGQKGTGMWAVMNALEFAIPLNLIASAVFERNISAMKELRGTVHERYGLQPQPKPLSGDGVKRIENALFDAKLVSYAQGFQLMNAASVEKGWHLDLASVARIWRGGCIIRSAFLDKIADAYERNAELQHLLLDDYFVEAIGEGLEDWREVIAVASRVGLPQPAGSAALHYLYSLSADRLPANLIQAQRDFFGAHTFERVDTPRGEFFHEEWGGVEVTPDHN